MHPCRIQVMYSLIWNNSNLKKLGKVPKKAKYSREKKCACLFGIIGYEDIAG